MTKIKIYSLARQVEKSTEKIARRHAYERCSSLRKIIEDMKIPNNREFVKGTKSEYFSTIRTQFLDGIYEVLIEREIEKMNQNIVSNLAEMAINPDASVNNIMKAINEIAEKQNEPCKIS